MAAAKGQQKQEAMIELEKYRNTIPDVVRYKKDMEVEEKVEGYDLDVDSMAMAELEKVQGVAESSGSSMVVEKKKKVVKSKGKGKQKATVEDMEM
tara:strand:- start:201 stop:485 length:285 start_codon:yes stop_codon:yes gene_type:complete